MTLATALAALLCALVAACAPLQPPPAERVAGAAAVARPDLVIHVGDYHYRENACPPGNAGCAGSPWGYGWDTWDADFFTPARRLLAAAPWIVARGNHESCNRAGQGWWRLLDPRPLAPGRDCNDAANDAIGDFSDPYAVPIAADTQFLVFDSSKSASTCSPRRSRCIGRILRSCERRSHSPIAAMACTTCS